MSNDKKRMFITNFTYYGIIFLIVLVIVKYGFPLLTPFLLGFLIAYLMQKPIRYVSDKTRIPKKNCSILMILSFYLLAAALVTLLITLLGASIKDFLMHLPEFYLDRIEPAITAIFDKLLSTNDQSLMNTFLKIKRQATDTVQGIFSDLSVNAMSAVSDFATAIPGLFIKFVLMIISSFFIASDYDKILDFCKKQLNEQAVSLIQQIEDYVVGTLFVVIRSYFAIMSLTFIELSIGLSILKIENAILIAALVALFDILPVLGTGGIMIPWGLLTLLQGNFSLGIGLLSIYVVVTIIRNIVEPKLVGKQLGLHPVVTLASMTVGAQLFGGIGLFGFPIVLSLFMHLNQKGVISILKTGDA